MMNSQKKITISHKHIQKNNDTLPLINSSRTSSTKDSLENNYLSERLSCTKRGITPRNTSPSKKVCVDSATLVSKLSFAGMECYDDQDIYAEKSATKCLASVNLLRNALDNSVCRPCVINNQLGIVNDIFRKVFDIAQRSSMGKKQKGELMKLRDNYLSKNIAHTKKIL